MPAPNMVKAAEVCNRLGIVRSTLYAWVARGWLPKAEQISSIRDVGWRKSTIDAFERAYRRALGKGFTPASAGFKAVLGAAGQATVSKGPTTTRTPAYEKGLDKLARNKRR